MDQLYGWTYEGVDGWRDGPIYGRTEGSDVLSDVTTSALVIPEGTGGGQG